MNIVEAMREAVGDRIQEAWGDPIDVTAFLTDVPGWFPSTSSVYSTRFDRSDGRFRPIYQTEAETRQIRAMSWLLVERVPMAKAWVNRLVDYTIGAGFEWTIRHENTILEGELRRFVREYMDNSKWSSELEVESFVREVSDGEFLGENVNDDGSYCLVPTEPDELTEPLRARELDEWLGIEDWVPSWSFGILTKKHRPDRAIGYHFVRDDAGMDWSFVKESKVVHWKRNVRMRAKRGVSDFYLPHLYLLRADRVLTNTAEAAAIQAAIAYIVEHPPNSTFDRASDTVNALATSTGRTDPVSGLVQRRRKMNPGTRIDVPNGQKYQPGMVGQNNSQIYVTVMEAAIRLAGTVRAFPEGMLTGSYQNANYASSLTAESPFVLGRQADQKVRAERMREMILKVIRLAAEKGRFRKATAEGWREVRAGLTVEITPSRVTPRDPDAHAAALAIQKQNGWVSDVTAMQELGRDVDVEKANGLEVGKTAGGPPGAAPGGMPGVPGMEGIDESEDAGSPQEKRWMGLSRLQWKRDMRAVMDVLADVAAGRMRPMLASVMLQSIGMPEDDAQRLIADSMDGQVSGLPTKAELATPEPPKAPPPQQPPAKPPAAKPAATPPQPTRKMEAFCPTGKGGKVDNSCSSKKNGRTSDKGSAVKQKRHAELKDAASKIDFEHADGYERVLDKDVEDILQEMFEDLHGEKLFRTKEEEQRAWDSFVKNNRDDAVLQAEEMLVEKALDLANTRERTWRVFNGAEGKIAGARLKFKTSSETEFLVDMAREDWILGKPAPEGGFDLTFSTGGRFDITGESGPREALEVFREVSAATTAWVGSEKPPYLTFSAKEPNRAKLYERLVRTTASMHPDYKAVMVRHKKNKDMPTKFFLVHKDKEKEIMASLNDARVGFGDDGEQDSKFYTGKAIEEAVDPNAGDIEIVELEPAGDDEDWMTEEAWQPEKTESTQEGGCNVAPQDDEASLREAWRGYP